MEINQFHSGTAIGDAITNQMLSIQKLLQKEGYTSEVYTENVAKGLEKNVKNIKTYKGNKENILFVHHSMGFDIFDYIVQLPDKKALIYHNITPERFFDDEHTKMYIRKGLKQAKVYKDYLDYFIAASNYNRKELISMGHKNIDVMPVQISVDRFNNIKSNKNILKNNKTINILFVGRLVRNKCQHEVIKSFAAYYKNFNQNSRLFLVGDDSITKYIKEINELTRNIGIHKNVFITGKVSEEELKAYYEIADVFLCMSEHEGFGVPLLESMKMGVPVIAYKSSAIAETMNGAGILVTEKNSDIIGSLINEIITDKYLNNTVIKKQYERIERLNNSDTKKILFKAIENIRNNTRKRTIQMQGPFETSYSLAIVNRKLIQAIDNQNKDDISIYSTEGPGDYEPKKSDLSDKPQAERLWKKSKETIFPDITIRNMYPPRVSDVNGGLNFQSFAWEEDRVPQDYINNFNKYLNGIGTTSNFVTKALINSGLKIPVKTIGNGVDLPINFYKLEPYVLKTKKKNKFLHISSAFPRKGIDILLKAYFNAFNNDDDVCLIIKTFPNIHNNVDEQIETLKNSYNNSPEVEVINKDISDEKLYSLYKAADCYVHAARGEGFGLPVAEAMLAKIPVIVSPNTGLADFCNEDTALLIDYEMEPANAHVSDGISNWAKPNMETLSELLKKFIKNKESLNINNKINNAYNKISEYYTWEKTAERWLDFINDVQENQYRPKVAMITTWNNKCGIAEYSGLLFNEIKQKVELTIYPNYGANLIKMDETYVAQRLWQSAFNGDLEELKREFKRISFDILHFQFHFGFFKLEYLASLITELYKDVKIIITFHKTKDSNVLGKIVSLKNIKNQLNLCYKLIVHQNEDKDILINMGINPLIINIIPHGQIVYPERTKEYILDKIKIKRSLILGSYGFLLPNKGIKENIESLVIIKKQYPDVLYIITCALHECIESKDYYEECKKEVNKHNLNKNVIFITEFLPNDESIVLLQACDILLMTYNPSNESASGAVRFCIAALRPIITTKQDIFKEFSDCTYQIDTSDANKITDAVIEIVNNKEKTDYLVNNVKEKIRETNWERVGNMTYSIYNNIKGNKIC